MPNELLAPLRLQQPSSAGGGDLQSALQMFQSGVQQFQMSRALSGANSQVQDIRASDMKEEEKTSALRQIASGLTLQMAGMGGTAAQMKQVTEAIQPPEQPLIQSFDQAMIYGTPDQQARAKDAEKFKNDLKMKATEAGMAPEDDFARANKYNTALRNWNGDIVRTYQGKSAGLSQANTVFQQGQRYQTMIANAKGDYDSLNPGQVVELAGSTAKMVLGNNITEGELKMFVPATAGMTKAKAAEWIESHPQKANAAGFVDLYNHIAMREQNLAGQQMQEGILAAATRGARTIRRLDPNADLDIKNTVSATLTEKSGRLVKPEDVIIDTSGKVTTTDQLKKEHSLDLYSRGVKEASMALNSDNAAAKQKAITSLKNLGVEVESVKDKNGNVKMKLSRPMSEIQQLLKIRTMTGELE